MEKMKELAVQHLDQLLVGEVHLEIKKAAAAAVNASLKFGEAKTAFIAALVNEALRQEPSRVAAASRLGISRKHLWKLIKDMG